MNMFKKVALTAVAALAVGTSVNAEVTKKSFSSRINRAGVIAPAVVLGVSVLSAVGARIAEAAEVRKVRGGKRSKTMSQVLGGFKWTAATAAALSGAYLAWTLVGDVVDHNGEPKVAELTEALNLPTATVETKNAALVKAGVEAEDAKFNEAGNLVVFKKDLAAKFAKGTGASVEKDSDKLKAGVVFEMAKIDESVARKFKTREDKMKTDREKLIKDLEVFTVAKQDADQAAQNKAAAQLKLVTDAYQAGDVYVAKKLAEDADEAAKTAHKKAQDDLAKESKLLAAVTALVKHDQKVAELGVTKASAFVHALLGHDSGLGRTLLNRRKDGLQAPKAASTNS